MFDKDVTEILLKFLERKAAEAEKEILEKGTLSEDKAIPLLLKTQFNHIAHLDMAITDLQKTMDQRFEKVDQRFEKMEQKFDQKFMWLTGTVVASWVTIILTILFS